jgi:HAD superfamily hydrolase (TIGR01509 family)
MIRAILWDNDGVLVDTERLYFEATRSVLAENGAELTVPIYKEFLLKRSEGAWHLATDAGVSEREIPRLRSERDRRYSELLSQESLVMDHAAETLRRLCPHFKMGVVTSSRREHFDIIHRTSGLLPFFDFILTREDYANSKPDPEPYLLALQHTAAAKAECLAIEDAERGLRAAKAAGLSCWVVPTILTSDGDFATADRVLTHIAEVADLLLGPKLHSDA